MKTCVSCGVLKALTEFYPHHSMKDGLLAKCKECVRTAVRANRTAHHEYYCAYDRERAKRPSRKTRAANALKARRAANDAKIRARTAVGNAIRDGRLKRGPCEICGTTTKVEAHHDDYSRPLDVRWQCFKCHREHSHGQRVEVAMA